MENKVLAQNLKQIKHYDLELFNEILMLDSNKSNIELAQNENGEYNLLLEGVALHSINGAILEAEQIVLNFKNNENQIKIIYGLGLGYLVDCAANKIQKGKIIIYEPNLELIKFVLSIAQIDAILKENVILCTNKEKLKEYISNYANEKTELSISFLNSYKVQIEEIKDILYFAQKIQGEIIANKNTFTKLAPNAFMHTIFNLGKTFKNPNIFQLRDVYKNKTAVILCAGPSLEENIELIKNNQDKFVIFALNPTLKLLKKHEIKPDFVVAIEASNIIKQFEGIEASELYFITEAFVNHRVSNLKTKKTFNYLSSDSFFNFWVRDCLKIKENLKSAGTVSYNAFISALIMGFNKIILIGQDLAYKDGFCYSKECHFGTMECIYDENEKRFKIVPNNWDRFIESFKVKEITIEKAREIALKRLDYLNQNICTIKSCDGKLIPSKTDYLLFIEAFSLIAKEFQNSSIEFINSSFGAQIDGFKNVKLEEAIKNLEKVEKVNLENYSSDFDKDYIISKMDILLDYLKQYQSLIAKFLDDSNSLNEIIEKLIVLGKNKEINLIITSHLLKLEENIKQNNLEKLKEEFKTLNTEILFDIKGLSDSKTLILQ